MLFRSILLTYLLGCVRGGGTPAPTFIECKTRVSVCLYNNPSPFRLPAGDDDFIEYALLERPAGVRLTKNENTVFTKAEQVGSVEYCAGEDCCTVQVESVRCCPSDYDGFYNGEALLSELEGGADNGFPVFSYTIPADDDAVEIDVPRPQDAIEDLLPAGYNVDIGRQNPIIPFDDDGLGTLWGRTPGTTLVRVPVNDFQLGIEGECVYRVLVNGKGVSLEIVTGLELPASIEIAQEALQFTGDERNELIFGTPFDDVINGGAGRDIILGLAGNDELNAGDDSQRDYLFGGEGDDRLLAPGSALSIGEGEIEGKASQSANYEFGGPGDDYLRGGDGEDVQYGGDGNDKLLGGDGIDYQYGNDGDDVLVGNGLPGADKSKSINFQAGGAGDDYLQNGLIQFGEDGDDKLRAGAQFAYQFGGDGDDYLIGGAFHDVQYGEQGNDRLLGNGGNDFQIGGDGDDEINGHFGSDYQVGNRGNDHIVGGYGDDIQAGGYGDDVLHGNAGDDNQFGDYKFRFIPLPPFEGEGEGKELPIGEPLRLQGVAQLEAKLEAAANNHALRPLEQKLLNRIHAFRNNHHGQNNAGGALNLQAQPIDGGEQAFHAFPEGEFANQGGDDVLYGGDGDDYQDGGPGDDVLHGGRGKDNQLGGQGDDVLYGDDNVDFQQGGADRKSVV